MCPVLTSASGFHDESVISKFRKPVASEEASRFRETIYIDGINNVSSCCNNDPPLRADSKKNEFRLDRFKFPLKPH